VIVVSADAETRSKLEAALRDERYRVVLASTPAEADVAARSASAEMALIDCRIGPALEHMARLRKINPALGFVVIIGDDDSVLAVETARAGAYEFFIRPLEATKAAFRLGVALEKHSRALEERAYTVALEERLNNRTAEVMDSRDRIKTQFINTIRALEKALQAKNVYTEGHSRRVAEKSVEIARAMKVPREMIRHIELGALFHDIGKIGIRDAVLLKPGPLDDAEWAHMREHPIKGHDIASKIAMLHPVMAAVRNHHERWDGGGYPDKMKDTDIPLVARIVAIADAYDAMSTDRPYKKALSLEECEAILRKTAGKMYDPELIDVFVKHHLGALYREDYEALPYDDGMAAWSS
jgi:putative nucleotidyltransferase with HDIG domain